MQLCKILSIFLFVSSLSAGERINHAGRILGPAPSSEFPVPFTAPVLFNTPTADAIVSAMQIFPRDSAWNEDISSYPVLSNSDAMIAMITSDLRSDRRTLRPFHEMNFVLVPDNQPMVPIDFFLYGDESDPSPYPIPSNMPIETWPRETGGLTLSEWQQDINETGGDRHAIVVMPGSGFLWETWLTRLTSTGWEAANGARFDLKSNALRPTGWTSADAAGLAMFPAIVRYDECQRGMVEHAMRLIVKRTRLGPIYPANHNASVGNLTDPNIPAMGQRLRLKSSFVIPENWNMYERAVALGLKKYGAIVADNGNFFSISVTPDDRYPEDAFARLSTIAISNFEVVVTTGLNEGPRSPNPPQADAGPDSITIPPGTTVALNGTVQNATVTKWKLYSGPAQPIFADSTSASTTATFSALGQYILLLEAADGVHTPAYDAIRVTVSPEAATFNSIRIARTGPDFTLSWDGSNGSYTVQESATPTGSWTDLAAISGTSFEITPTGNHRFFRVVRH